MLYTISLKRAEVFYVLVLIVPTITITILSFVVFWSPTEAADALGYPKPHPHPHPTLTLT